jgi:hypothetical protein
LCSENVLIYGTIIVDYSSYILNYQNGVVEYLEEHNHIKDMSYYSLIFNHKDVLKKTYDDLEYRDEKKLIILYALINATDYWVDSDKLSVEIDKFDLTNETYYEVSVFIEREEISLVKVKKNNPSDYEAEIEESIQRFKDLESRHHQKDNLGWLINHHIGKLYCWKRDQDNAVKYLEIALGIDENAVSTMLQLARVYLSSKITIPLAKKQIEYVLDIENRNKVQLTILLSFYELLAKYELKEERQKYIINENDAFRSIIQMSLHSSFDQPFRVVKALASGLAYECPTCFKDICEQMPFPDNISSNERLRFAYAQIQASYYKLLKYQRDIPKEQMHEIYSISEKYFLKSELNNDYKRKMLLDLYIEAEKFDKANKLSDLFEDQESVFFLQSKCKILKNLKKLDFALDIINKAIKLEENDKKRVQYLAAFYNDKAEVEFAQKEKECSKTLKKAIEFQTTKRTKDSWNEKLKLWESD